MSSTNLKPAEPAAEWDSELLKALYRLVFSASDREVAGVLVGNPAERTSQPMPTVRAAIPATQGFAVGEAAMFDHKTWAVVHDTMARHYGGLDTVGWYVSRPGHGTDLIGADIANHQQWFGRRDQILLVVDSQSHRAAVYGWGPAGIVRLTEGPVARRYTRPERVQFPSAATALLSIIGVSGGALAFLITQATGS